MDQPPYTVVKDVSLALEDATAHHLAPHLPHASLLRFGLLQYPRRHLAHLPPSLSLAMPVVVPRSVVRPVLEASGVIAAVSTSTVEVRMSIADRNRACEATDNAILFHRRQVAPCRSPPLLAHQFGHRLRPDSLQPLQSDHPLRVLSAALHL